LIVEASVAGQGQGDAGQGEATQQQGPDLSALADQLGTLSAGQDEMREFLQSQPWQTTDAPQEQQAGEPELDLDLSQYIDAEGQYDPAQVSGVRGRGGRRGAFGSTPGGWRRCGTGRLSG
jgi:hypothetical protein